MKLYSERISVSGIRLYPIDVLDCLTVRFGADAYEEIYRLYSQSALGTPFVLLRGIQTEEEWRNGLSLCHRCICDLYEDRREVNGYLPRGMMIDTPVALTPSTRFWGCDFFCVDYDRLCRLSSGEEVPPSLSIRHAVENQIRLFLEHHKGLEARLLCRSSFDEDLGRFSMDCHIREVYLSEEVFPVAQHIFQSLHKEKK